MASFVFVESFVCPLFEKFTLSLRGCVEPVVIENTVNLSYDNTSWNNARATDADHLRLSRNEGERCGTGRVHDAEWNNAKGKYNSTMERRNAFSPCRCSTIVSVGVLRCFRAFRGTYTYTYIYTLAANSRDAVLSNLRGEFSRNIRGCAYGISKANPKREPPTPLLHRASMNGTFNAQSSLPEAMNWNSRSRVHMYVHVQRAFASVCVRCYVEDCTLDCLLLERKELFARGKGKY